MKVLLMLELRLLKYSKYQQTKEVENILIEYGTTEISEGPKGEKIAYAVQLICHDEYNEEDTTNDIGLVQVEPPFEIESQDFVRLPLRDSVVTAETPAVLAGEN